jgi:hypothetical protein
MQVAPRASLRRATRCCARVTANPGQDRAQIIAQSVKRQVSGGFGRGSRGGTGFWGCLRFISVAPVWRRRGAAFASAWPLRISRRSQPGFNRENAGGGRRVSAGPTRRRDRPGTAGRGAALAPADRTGGQTHEGPEDRRMKGILAWLIGIPIPIIIILYLIDGF